jgi:hypothetical protein
LTIGIVSLVEPTVISSPLLFWREKDEPLKGDRNG